MHRVLLEGPDHLEAGAVADVREPRVAMTAEVALEDEAVLRAIEEGAPLLELEDAVRRLLRVELGHAPVVEELAAAHGVAEVDLPVVLLPHVAQRSRDPALGHHGVRLPEERLAHQRGLHTHRARFDRGTQAGAARADDDDIEVVGLVLRHQLTHRRSVMTPIAQSRMYRSVSMTLKRLNQAQREWRSFSLFAQVQRRKRSDARWNESR